MSDKVPAHRIISQSIETQSLPPPPPPPPPPRTGRLVGGVLLLVVVGALSWWMGQSGGEPATVVPSRDVLRDGAAELDVLPGSDAQELVVIDERVEQDLRGLQAAEIAWLEDGNPPRSLPPCPAQDPVRGLHPWGGPCLKAWTAATSWEIPATSPCRFQIFAAPPDDFRLVAECDADGNGEFETWLADRHTEPHRVHVNFQ